MLKQQLHFIKKHQRGVSVLFVLCTIAATATALSCLELTPLPFRDLSFREGELMNLIMSLSVMAVFMERAVEAILVPIRTPDRQQIEQDIETLRADLADGADATSLLKEKEHELATYRLNTARYAYWLSYALGMAVSLVGVRALSGLVELKNFRAMQQNLFGLVDVIITGGVIAGGSAAVDKMGRRISKSLKLTSATASTLETKKEGCPPQDNAEGA